MIRQGDIFWIDLGDPLGSEPGYRHPYVVIQSDAFNQSRIRTVIVCALTSNLRRAKAPGNVLLEEGEGRLTKRSVVNVSQLYTVDRESLSDKVGALSRERIVEIVDGVKLVLEPRAPEIPADQR